MVDAKTLGVFTSAGISLLVLFVILLAFELLRHKLSAIYYYRNQAESYFLNHDGRKLGTAPLPGVFWPATVIPYSHAAIRESHGLDDVLFLRYLRTQATTFFAIAAVAGTILFPTYATASNAGLPVDDERRVVGIEVLSLANVRAGDDRLWAVLFAELIVVAIICFFQYRDMAYYTALRREYRSSVRPANYTVLVSDLPDDARTADAVYALFDTVFPGMVEAVHPVRRAAKLQKLRDAYQAAYMKREAHDEAGVKGETVRVEGQKEPVDAGDHWRVAEDEAFAAASKARENLSENAPVTHAAFVVFRTKQTATAAVSAPVTMNGMIVHRAPEPDAVFWNRIHPSKRSEKARKYVTYALVLLMIIFWFVPVAGVQLLHNLESLGKRDGLGFIADFTESLPDLAALIEGLLPPILLLTLNLLVPIFVRLILGRSRFFGRPNLDAAVMRWVFLFYVVTSFGANIIVGTLLSTLETLTDNPTLSFVVVLLSNRIPAQSSFFLNYVAIQMGVNAGLGILMIGKLWCRPYCMAGAKSVRMRRKKGDAFSAFPFFKIYAIVSLHCLIGTVYSVVAPVVAIFVGVGFCFLYMTFKHVVMYSQRPLYYSAGRLFKTAHEHSWFSLFLHELILVGLFSLKGMAVLAILQGGILVLTLAFARHVRKKFYAVAAHGTLKDLFPNESVPRDIPEHFKDLYLHPALQGEIGDIESLDVVQEIDF